MRRRWLIIAVAALVALAVLIVGGWRWLLHSESGARFVLNRAGNLVPTASVGDLEGSLAGGLVIERLDAGLEAGRLTVDTLRLRVSVSPWPLTVTVHQLDAHGVHWLSGETPESDAPLTLPDAPSSITVIVEAANVTDVRVDGETVVDRASLSGQVGPDFVVDHLDVMLPAGHVNISGTLAGRTPHALDLSIETRLEPTDDADGWRITGSGRLSGDDDRLQLSGTLTEPAASLALTIDGWREAGAMVDGSVSADALSWPMDDPAAPALTEVTLALNGAVDALGWQLDARPRLDSMTDARLTASGVLSPDGVDAEHWTLQSTRQSWSGTARVGWSEAMSAEWTAELERLDTSPWWADEPLGPLRGETAGRWAEDALVIGPTTLQRLDGSGSLALAGTLDSRSDVADAELRWDQFPLPLTVRGEPLMSPAARFELSGQLSDWSLTGTAELAAPSEPAGQLTLSATGDRESAVIESFALRALGGELAGAGELTWSEPTRFAARASLQDVDLGGWLPGASAPFRGRIDAEGSLSGAPLRVTANDVTGGYRGRPVGIDGTVANDVDGWRADELVLRSDDTRVRLTGSPTAEGLVYDIEALSLADWLDDLSGRVDGAGRIRRFDRGYSLDGRLAAEQLAWPGGAAGSVVIEGAGDATQADLEMVATELSFGDQAVPRAVVGYRGPRDAQRASIDISGDGWRFDGEADGRIAGTAPWRWVGRLDAARMTTDGGLEVTLAAPATIDVSPEQAVLGDTCLAVSDGGRACIAAEWQAGASLFSEARMEGLSLTLLERIEAFEFALDQAVDGQWSLRLAATEAGWRLTDTDGRVTLSPGSIRYAAPGTRPVSTGPGALAWSVEAGRIVELVADLELPGVGRLDADGRVTDLTLGLNSPVTGRLALDIEDLSRLAPLAPELDQAAGRFSVRLDYGGLVSEPSVTGTISLSDGHFEYQPLGLALDDVSLDGRFLPGEPAEATGRFRSGDGEGQLNARIGFDGLLPARWRLGVRGRQLLLVNLPEARVIAEPDLVISNEGQRWDLQGQLLIPEARIAPRQEIGAEIPESPDVVIVGEESPTEAAPVSNGGVYGTVGVALGDDVEVRLGDATARLAGELELRWNGPAMPIADGTIDVTGQYRAYGQLLEINEGEVLFPDVPADNPQFDIRAVREVFGSNAVDEAGIHITGNARNIDLELYTDPPTNNERALAYLVTGADFDYSSGVGAVNVGTYLTPRLYVSYGIGLFESGNVVSARYDLAEHWGIKASSGERDTGVDVSYTIDR